MDYIGPIFRPPSEAESLLLQATVGCSHNACSFCAMYRGKSFSPKPWAVVERDIREAEEIGPRFRRVFLCDGDALVLSTRRLLKILSEIRARLPWVERVGVYGDTRGINPKSAAELTELRDAGLGIVYHGLESGDDEILRLMNKGGTRAEAVAAAGKLRDAGIIHSVMALLGLGGETLSERHARGTASALTEMDPPYVAALTVTVVPGTPLWDARERGDFRLPSKFGFLEELRTLVAESRFTGCRFSANHASNYLPLTGDLPDDRDELLSVLETILRDRDDSVLKPEWMRGL